jgi:lantibiotic modifying enzyme
MSWSPIISDGDLRSDCQKLLADISGHLSQCTDLDNGGLLVGSSGISVFFSYLYLHNKQAWNFKLAQRYLNHSLLAAERANPGYTFCNGIAGIAWTVIHLKEMELFSYEIDDIISSEIDDFLLINARMNLAQGNYDFLHGASGAMVTLAKRKKHNLDTGLTELIDTLAQASDTVGSGIAWRDTLQEGEGLYNLGLAHGMPSILVLLSCLYENNIAPTLTLALISKCFNWIVDQERDSKEDFLYPTLVGENSITNGKSRLGWCYGDLSVAAGLMVCGRKIKNERMINKAINIALHAANRKNLPSNGVTDTCVCHGSAGIAHIFNRFYHYTGNEKFRDAAIDWFKETIALWRRLGHLKYYQVDRSTNKISWVDRFGILEGIAGVGLCLLGAIDTNEPKWDSSLLIS